MVSTGLGAGNQSRNRHILALLDFRQDLIGLMIGPFSESFSTFWKLMFLVAAAITHHHLPNSGQPHWSQAHLNSGCKTPCLMKELPLWQDLWAWFYVLTYRPGVLEVLLFSVSHQDFWEFRSNFVLNSYCLSLQTMERDWTSFALEFTKTKPSAKQWPWAVWAQGYSPYLDRYNKDWRKFQDPRVSFSSDSSSSSK